jgi:hypothetical protein
MCYAEPVIQSKALSIPQQKDMMAAVVLWFQQQAGELT